MTDVQIQTPKGNINLELFDANAPMTVASFLYLIDQGYYNGLNFHRVIADFMIQGGCPFGKGNGDPQGKGIKSFPYQGKQIPYPFKDEFKNGKKFAPGILAMANAGPSTNGSQFFITHVATPHLQDKHTIFGTVKGPEDQKVVNAIKQGDKINKIVRL
jgi:peptidyl-prolyl cis-trans isomerase B (cyclophilin B)